MQKTMTNSTAYGTAGGIVLSIITTSGNTAIIAAVGATVSFFVSLYFKWLLSSDEDRAKIELAFKRFKRKK